MDFKESTIIGITLAGVLATIIFGFIKPEYQTQIWVFGLLGILLFVVVTPIITKLYKLVEKMDLLDKETKKLNEKLKIYKHLANLDTRIKNIENKKR